MKPKKNDKRDLNLVKKFKFFSNKISKDFLIGNYRSIFKSSGIEFNDARPYVEGDDVRNIDWNLTSRLDSVHSKTFKEDRSVASSLQFKSNSYISGMAVIILILYCGIYLNNFKGLTVCERVEVILHNNGIKRQMVKGKI